MAEQRKGETVALSEAKSEKVATTQQSRDKFYAQCFLSSKTLSNPLSSAKHANDPILSITQYHPIVAPWKSIPHRLLPYITEQGRMQHSHIPPLPSGQAIQP